MATFLSGLAQGYSGGRKTKDGEDDIASKPKSVKNIGSNLKRIGRDIKGVFGGKKSPTAVGDSDIASPPEYRRGGKVKRTGIAKVHKGERVLTARQARKYRKTRRGGRRR